MILSGWRTGTIINNKQAQVEISNYKNRKNLFHTAVFGIMYNYFTGLLLQKA